MECPECGGDAEEWIDGSPEVETDGHGLEEWITRYYSCSECGCEFTVTRHITTEITIDKHGKYHDKDK